MDLSLSTPFLDPTPLSEEIGHPLAPLPPPWSFPAGHYFSLYRFFPSCYLDAGIKLSPSPARVYVACTCRELAARTPLSRAEAVTASLWCRSLSSALALTRSSLSGVEPWGDNGARADPRRPRADSRRPQRGFTCSVHASCPRGLCACACARARVCSLIPHWLHKTWA